MLHRVMRSCIDSLRIASPRYSTAWYWPPSMPKRPMRNSITSFAATPSPKAPSNSMAIVCGTFSQISPVTSTPTISVAPMPNMYAANAPPVGEWLSAPTANMPGRRCPRSGSTMWQMPCAS